MRHALTMFVILLALCGLSSAGDCVSVHQGRILGADLARAVPEFGTLDPELVVGYSPLPGTERILTGSQLRQLARRNGLPEEGIERACFVRAAEPLTQEQITEVLHNSLKDKDVQIELLDFCRKPVPPGQISFPVSGLRQPTAGTMDSVALWHGKLIYDGRRSIRLWARVRVTAERRQVVAVNELRPGHPIGRGDIKEVAVASFPEEDPPLKSSEYVVGALPRRTIQAGAPIYAEQLRLPNDVERGDTVVVEVISGAAQVRFDAEVESSGRVGDMVYVRNPANGKRFTATIAEKGRVVVQADHGNGGIS